MGDESASGLLPFSWLASSCPFPSYGLTSLPYFSSLHSCDLLGAKDAREKVASPQCLTYRILLMQVPHGKLGAIFYLETFQPYTADPAAASLPHYPLRGHLHGNKWFLHFVLQAESVLQRGSWGSEQEVTEVCFQLASGRNVRLEDTLSSISAFLWHRKLWTFLSLTPGMTGCRKSVGLVRTEGWRCSHWEGRWETVKLASLMCH